MLGGTLDDAMVCEAVRLHWKIHWKLELQP